MYVGEYRPREQGLRLEGWLEKLTNIVGEYRPREQGLRPVKQPTYYPKGQSVGEYRPREQGLRRCAHRNDTTHKCVGEYRPREQGLRLYRHPCR